MQKNSLCRRIPVLLSVIACLFICAVSTHAQDTAKGIIKGIITEPNGSVASNIRVTIVVQATGLEPRTETTSSSGEYTFADLVAGIYKITVEGIGFKKIVASDIEVISGDTQMLKFTLESGDSEETIDIAPEVHSTPPA
ncbi:MAG TPA: carboxypeptidase-like regulatory domain-containing protein [Pyrinomonadaceae bacterium]|jgi:hypothetical protein